MINDHMSYMYDMWFIKSERNQKEITNEFFNTHHSKHNIYIVIKPNETGEKGAVSYYREIVCKCFYHILYSERMREW